MLNQGETGACIEADGLVFSVNQSHREDWHML